MKEQHDCPACALLRSHALAIVGAVGIDALSLDSLSRHSGMRLDDVVSHYPTATECLHDTYDHAAQGIYVDFADALRQGTDWSQALTLAVRRVLARLAARPEEARLCFVEVLRGDRDLLRRSDAARRRVVELFAREYARRCDPTRVPPTMQVELLIGAGFRAIAATIDEGRPDGLPELEPDLTSLADVFQPVAS